MRRSFTSYLPTSHQGQVNLKWPDAVFGFLSIEPRSVKDRLRMLTLRICRSKDLLGVSREQGNALYTYVYRHIQGKNP